MRRLQLVGLALFVLLAMHASAAAQGDLDCADFEFQEDAQAVYDQDPSDPHGLDGNDNDGRACEHLPSRGTGGQDTTTQATPVPQSETVFVRQDRDCSDFSSQREAQAFFESEGGPAEDPHRLDADDDGVACERNFRTTASTRRTRSSRSNDELPVTGSSTLLLGLGGFTLLEAGCGLLLLQQKLQRSAPRRRDSCAWETWPRSEERTP